MDGAPAGTASCASGTVLAMGVQVSTPSTVIVSSQFLLRTKNTEKTLYCDREFPIFVKYPSFSRRAWGAAGRFMGIGGAMCIGEEKRAAGVRWKTEEIRFEGILDFFSSTTLPMGESLKFNSSWTEIALVASMKFSMALMGIGKFLWQTWKKSNFYGIYGIFSSIIVGNVFNILFEKCKTCFMNC